MLRRSFSDNPNFAIMKFGNRPEMLLLARSSTYRDTDLMIHVSRQSPSQFFVVAFVQTLIWIYFSLMELIWCNRYMIYETV